jgi:hypothetical protein
MKIINIVLVALNLAFLIFFLASYQMMTTSTSADVLRVKAIELVGESGKVRARLNVEESGEVVFRMLDETGTIRVKLGASESGSGLVLLNEKTEPGIQLLSGQSGTRLMVTGQDGTQQIIEP